MAEKLALRPEDVAEEIGMSPTQIRNLMRLGRFNPPIGYAHKGKGKRYSYVVYRTMLDEYLHKQNNEGNEISQLVELVKAQKEENSMLKDLVRSLIATRKETE